MKTRKQLEIENKLLRKAMKESSKFFKTRFEWMDCNYWHQDFHDAVMRLDKPLRFKKRGDSC